MKITNLHLVLKTTPREAIVVHFLRAIMSETYVCQAGRSRRKFPGISETPLEIFIIWNEKSQSPRTPRFQEGITSSLAFRLQG